MLLFFFFHFFLQFNYFDSQNNHLNFKQDPITNVWSIFYEKWHFHMFCTQITKMSDFRADMQRQKVTWPCNYRSDFFFFFKDAQDSKEKSQRAARRHPYAFSNNQKNRGGGGIMPPGLIRVKLLNEPIYLDEYFSRGYENSESDSTL